MRIFLAGFGIAAAFAAFAALGCRKPEVEAEHDRPPVPIRTAKAERRALRPTFEVVGIVMADPARTATLSAAAPGLIEKLAVAEGAKVTLGQLVVQLDDRVARNDLARAQAAQARLIARPRQEEFDVGQSEIGRAHV